MTYSCPICNSEYPKQADLLPCQTTPISHAGVKRGQMVKILIGEGRDKIVPVSEVRVIGKQWGKTYLHTVAVEVKVKKTSRLLNFNEYQVIKGE